MRGIGLVLCAVIVALVLAAVVAVVAAQTERSGPSAGTVVAQQPPAAPTPPARPGRRGRPSLEAMRQRMMQAGATEADLQAIRDYMTQQRDIQAPLREAMGSLRDAMGPDASDEQAKEAVSKYEAAMKTALDKLAKAEQDLKAKLDLANKPKLHAMLLMMGVLDNGMRRGMWMMGPRPAGPGGAGERPGVPAPAPGPGG